MATFKTTHPVRLDVTVLLSARGQLVQSLHLLGRQVDDLPVLLDTSWGDRLGENDDTSTDEVAEEDGAWFDVVLFRDLGDGLFLEQRRTGRTERRVGLEEDAGEEEDGVVRAGADRNPEGGKRQRRDLPLFRAVLVQLVLRVVRVEFDLLDRDTYGQCGSSQRCT
jgi:hypothetical protein